MRIGELRDRITVQQQVETIDTQGGRAVAWALVATVWASVVARSVTERMQAKAVGSLVDYLVEIRPRPDVTPDMRILWRPYMGTLKTLEIHGVTLKDGKRARMQLECSEVV